MKILLIGMGGLYNRGCEAIVHGSKKILTQIFPGAEIAVAVGTPEIASQDQKRLSDLGIEVFPLIKQKKPAPSFPLRLMNRVVYELTKKSIFNSPWLPLGYPDKGWDLILEVGGDTFANTNNLIYKSLHDQWLMDSKGFRVGLWGLNLIPFDSKEISKEGIKRIFSRYQIITVRDEWSKNYLTEIGVTKYVFHMGDPAFEMDSIKWDVEPFFSKKSERGTIGLNLSPIAGQYRTGGEKEVINLAIETARKLNRLGFGVLFVPHCFPPACPEFDDDNLILRPAFEQLRSEDLDVGLLPGGLSSPQVKYAISKCTLFAGARMHSTIAAWSTGVPVLTISYSPKSLNINDDIYGHRRYVVDIRSVTTKEIADTLDSMANDLDMIRQATNLGVNRIREHTQILIKKLKEDGLKINL